MATQRAQTAQSKAREEARKVADRIETEFPPETAFPMPFADTMGLGANAMQHWMETSQEMAKFYQARLAKDIRYMTALGTCRTPADLAAVCTKAASEAAHDYAEQLEKVVAINLNGNATAAADDKA